MANAKLVEVGALVGASVVLRGHWYILGATFSLNKILPPLKMLGSLEVYIYLKKYIHLHICSVHIPLGVVCNAPTGRGMGISASCTGGIIFQIAVIMLTDTVSHVYIGRGSGTAAVIIKIPNCMRSAASLIGAALGQLQRKIYALNAKFECGDVLEKKKRLKSLIKKWMSILTRSYWNFQRNESPGKKAEIFLCA